MSRGECGTTRCPNRTGLGGVISRKRAAAHHVPGPLRTVHAHGSVLLGAVLLPALLILPVTRAVAESSASQTAVRAGAESSPSLQPAGREGAESNASLHSDGDGSDTPGRSASEEPIDLRSVGSGKLLWKSQQGLIPLPIVDMNVELSVTGIMVRGSVTQSFENRTWETIEAVYVFPLPERAAVDSMEMQIGERRVVSVVREREEARATYERAVREGKKASLLEQERPNLFTTAIANVNPGERVVVKIEYLEELSYLDGRFSLTFPLTYTPRYVPASSRSGAAKIAGAFAGNSKPSEQNAIRTTRDDQPDGSGSSGASFGPDVQDFRVTDDRRRPMDRGPDAHDFQPNAGDVRPSAPSARLRVHIEQGVLLESVRSPSHRIHWSTERAATLIEPDGGPVPADRDFVLSWGLRLEDDPKGTLFVEDREDGRYGLVMLLPPIPESDAGEGLSTETVFVVDVSGSMDGPSIVQARAALLTAIDRLRPGDSFNIIKFNQSNEPFRDASQPVNDEELDEARRWVRALQASGGTEILPALLRGLAMVGGDDARAETKRVVLITDGAVGNEEEVFMEVVKRLGTTRLHVVGIGPAPNRHLMSKLAELGRGAYESIGSVQDVRARMDSFLARLERPVMTDVSLEWEGAPPLEAFPARAPDLYAGQPLFVSFRLGPAHPGTKLVLSGRAHDGAVRQEIRIDDAAPAGSGIATRWARAKVEELMDSLREGADAAKVRKDVVEVAKSFHLVTAYTSLVAVEEVPSAEGAGRSVRALNGLPQGSTLAESGSLPQGGTSGPLLLLLGVTLTTAGCALALLTRVIRS